MNYEIKVNDKKETTNRSWGLYSQHWGIKLRDWDEENMNVNNKHCPTHNGPKALSTLTLQHL